MGIMGYSLLYMGNYGIFLTTGNAGFLSSTVFRGELLRPRLYMVRRSAGPPPPPPPPWSMVQDATRLLPPVGGVLGPSSPCGVVVGFLGFWVSLKLLNLRFRA